MNGAQAVAKCLEIEQTKYIFGYPGVAICPVFDALLDTNIRMVLVRQEQNAAHEASGYARIAGKPGVVAVTSGPGAENLITGIATAFADSIPLICITGQVDSKLMGSDVFQEADISGAAESFVKYSYVVRNADDIPRIFKEAFYIATSGRKGPVLIDIPQDIQEAELTSFDYPKSIVMRTYRPTVSGNEAQMKKVIAKLATSKRPLICAGGGIHLSGATHIIREFAKKTGIPVVTTMMGIGVMPTDDPLYFGMIGNNGTKTANAAVAGADMILLVGARIADRSVRSPELMTDAKVLAHIDVDPAEIGKNAGATIPLVGDANMIFSKFLSQDIGGDYSEWVAQLRALKECHAAQSTIAAHNGQNCKKKPGTVDPTIFIRALSMAMDDDAIYVADVGQNQLWSCAHCVIKNGRFLTSGGMGTMGYALPAAIGASLADPSRQVVAVCGDGAFQMSMMELSTASQYGVPVKLAILKNGTLGLVRQYQTHAYKRHGAISLDGGPELEHIAAAYGMRFLHLKSESDMDSIIDRFLEKGGQSVLLQCDIDPEREA